MDRAPPADEKAAIEAYVASLRVTGFVGKLFKFGAEGYWRGHRYYVSCADNPICRVTYTGQPDKPWECAIYRPSQGRYGSDGMFFPRRGDVNSAKRAIKMALGAHEFPTVETDR